MSFKKIMLVITLSILTFTTNAQTASPLISVSIQEPTLFRATAKVGITNKDDFPRIVLVKIFNGGVDGDLVSEVSTTVDAKDSISIEAQPNTNTKFVSPISWRYYETIGDNRVKNKDNNFQIPFKSDFKARVCQSSDGPQTTHIGQRVNAIDFCAPLKTPIVAAKDGTVIEVVQHFTEGGNNPNLIGKENKIRILHDDGLISEYTHIFTNSASVRVRDRVKKGQQIALVGNVGYSTGAHLHFEVTEGDTKLNSQNNLLNVIPVNFINSNNEEIKISNGGTYTVAGQIGGLSQQKSNKASQPSPNNAPRGNASKNDCDNPNVDLIKQANDCYISKRFNKAIDILNKYVATNTTNPRAYGLLAMSLSRDQKYDESIPIFQKRISFGQYGFDICAFYAISLNAVGNINESIIWNKKALEIAPSLIDVRSSLAEQLVKTGKQQEAIKLLQSFDDGRVQKGQNRIFTAKIEAIKNGN